MIMLSRTVALLLASFVAGHNPPVSAPEDVRMITVDGEGAKYWPRWRGPSGQGHVTGTNYVDTWSEKENIKWRVPVPGLGHHPKQGREPPVGGIGVGHRNLGGGDEDRQPLRDARHWVVSSGPDAETGAGASEWASGNHVCIGARPAFVP